MKEATAVIFMVTLFLLGMGMIVSSINTVGVSNVEMVKTVQYCKDKGYGIVQLRDKDSQVTVRVECNITNK